MNPRSFSRKAEQPRRPRQEIMDLVTVDPHKLQWHMQRSALSKSTFADTMGIGRTSLYRMLDGIPVKRSTVFELAKHLAVAPDDLLTTTPVELTPEEQTSSWHHPEWQVVPGTLSPFRSMSNGLVMRVAKVRHRVLPDEYGRAKVYDIAGMPAAVREQCREALTRHAVVCRKVAACPYITKNLTMTALNEGSLWTAVDSWFEAHPLADDLRDAPLSWNTIRTIMTQVGGAIAELHAQGILARELHPESILVRQDDGRCLITDLELAKLLEVEATVSSRWQPNPYRAPEVISGCSQPQADLYSLARLFVHLAVGDLPEFPDDVAALESKLPAGRLRTTLHHCLSPNWRKRPDSVSILQEMLVELETFDG